MRQMTFGKIRIKKADLACHSQNKKMTEFATYRSCIMANGYLTLTFRFAKKLKTTIIDIR